MEFGSCSVRYFNMGTKTCACVRMCKTVQSILNILHFPCNCFVYTSLFVTNYSTIVIHTPACFG
jgi:hypothetical protein